MASQMRDGSFPDMHHKMSKKIAQLTKVIYYLNTKNDDCEYEVSQVSRSYEDEINDVLKDATEKMKKVYDEVDAARNNEKAIEQLKALALQHEEEKSTALSQLEDLKKSAQKQLLERENFAEDRIRKLTEDVNIVKEQFAEQMEAFAKANEKLSSQSSKGFDSLRSQHEKEMADLVVQYNEKYRVLITEQLQLREDEKDELTREYEEKIRKMKEEIESIGAQQLKEETTRLKSLLSSTLLEKSEEEEEHTRLREKLEGEINKIRELSAQQSAQIESLNHRIEELNVSLSGKEDEVTGLQKNLDETQRTVRELESEKSALLESSGAHVEKMLSDLNELRNNMSELEDEKDSYISKLKKLQSEFDSLKREKMELDVALSVSKKEKESLQESLTKTEIALREMEKEASDLNIKMIGLKEGHGKLDSRIELLEIQHRDELERRRVAYEAEKSKIETNFENRELNQKKEHENMLQKTTDEYESKIYTLNATISDKEKELRRLNSEIMSKDESSQKGMGRLEEQMQNLQKEKAEILKEMRTQSAEMQAEFKKQIKELETKLSASADDKRSLKERLDSLNEEKDRETKNRLDLEGKIKQLLIDIERTKKEGEAALKKLEEMHIEDMKKQKQKWEEDLRDSVYSKEAELNSNFQQGLEKLRGRLMNDHEKEKDELLRQMEGKLNEKSMGNRKLQDEIHDLDGKISTLQENSAEKLKLKEEELKRLQDECELRSKGLLEGLSNEKRELEEEHRRKLQEEVANWKKENDGLLSKLEGEKDQLIRELKAEREKALRELEKDMLNKFNDDRKKLSAKHDTELASRLEEEKRMFEAQLRAQTKKWEEENTEVLREKQSMGQKLSNLGDQLDAVMRSLDAKDKEIGSLSAEKDKLTTDLSSSKSQLEEKEKMFELEKSNITRDYDKRLKSQQELHEDEMKRSKDRHSEAMKRLREECEDAVERMDGKNALLEQKIMEWELKYENRESRSDDVERIRTLENELIRQESIARKAVENMNVYKMELSNKEETYTKTFGRTPTVGLMNPVSSKPPRGGGRMQRNTSAPKLPPLGATRPSSASRSSEGGSYRGSSH